jgi:hypothetical protein
MRLLLSLSLFLVISFTGISQTVTLVNVSTGLTPSSQNGDVMRTINRKAAWGTVEGLSIDLGLNVANNRITFGNATGTGVSGSADLLKIPFGISSTDLLLVAQRNYGYIGGTYRAVQIGSNNIALGYDPSTNANGNFGGNGDIITRNYTEFITPNQTNDNWYRMLRFQDGNIKLPNLPSADDLTHNFIIGLDANTSLRQYKQPFDFSYATGKLSTYSNWVTRFGIGKTPQATLDILDYNADYFRSSTGLWGSGVLPQAGILATAKTNGGYSTGIYFAQNTSTGVTKMGSALEVIGTSSWNDTNTATQTSDLIFIHRNAALDRPTIRGRITDNFEWKLNKQVIVQSGNSGDSGLTLEGLVSTPLISTDASGKLIPSPVSYLPLTNTAPQTVNMNASTLSIIGALSTQNGNVSTTNNGNEHDTKYEDASTMSVSAVGNFGTQLFTQDKVTNKTVTISTYNYLSRPLLYYSDANAVKHGSVATAVSSNGAMEWQQPNSYGSYDNGYVIAPGANVTISNQAIVYYTPTGAVSTVTLPVTTDFCNRKVTFAATYSGSGGINISTASAAIGNWNTSAIVSNLTIAGNKTFHCSCDGVFLRWQQIN